MKYITMWSKIPCNAFAMSIVLFVAALPFAMSEYTPTRNMQEDIDLSAVDFVFTERLFTLPNYTLEQERGGLPLSLTLYNIRCENVTVDDVDLRHTVEKPQDIFVNLEVIDLNTSCSLEFGYNWGGLVSGGRAEIESTGSSIVADLLLRSKDLAKEAPSEVEVLGCDSTIKVDSVEFYGNSEGDLIVGFLNNMEDKLKEAMAPEIGAAVCQLFDDLKNGLGDFFISIEERLEPYISQEGSDPLYAEQNMTVPENIQLVNFLRSESSIEILMSILFDIAAGYLGTENGKGGLVINTVVSELLLRNRDSVVFDTSDIAFDFIENPLDDLAEYNVAPIDFGVTGIRFDRGGVARGLDNFGSVEPIRQIGKHTVELSFMLNEVLLDLFGTLDSRPRDGNLTYVEQDEFEVLLNLTNVNASIALLLALDEKSLGDVHLGNFLNGGSLECLLYSLHDLQITQVKIHELNYQSPVIRGLEDEPVTKAVVEAILALGFTAFDSLVAEALPTLLRDRIENFIVGYDVYSPMFNETCEIPKTRGIPDRHLDFRDLLLVPEQAKKWGTNGSSPYGTIVPDVKKVLDDNLFADNPVTKRPYINKRTLATLTKHQSGEEGTIDSTGVFFSTGRNLTFEDLESAITVEMVDLSLENINSFYSPLKVMNPIKGVREGISNFLTLGDVDSPVKIAFVLGIDLEINSEKTRNDFFVEIETKSLTFVVDMLLYIVERNLIKYPLKELFHPSCLMTLLESPALDYDGQRVQASTPPYTFQDFDLLMKDVTVEIGCSNCRSGAVKQLTAIASPVIRSIFSGGADVRFGGNGPESEGIIPSVERFLYSNRADIQKQIDLLLVNAPKQCPSHPEYDPSAAMWALNEVKITGIKTFSKDFPEERQNGVLSAVCAISTISILAYICLHLILRWINKRRQKRWLQSLPIEQIVAIYEQQLREDAKEARLNSFCPSILTSSDVPKSIKVFIPVALVATMVLFLCGFFSPSAEVILDANINGVDALDVAVVYSMATIVNLTWDAGGTSLSIAATLASGVWPLIKQLLTLCLAFAPPSALTVAKRGKCLHILDMLGKWSMFVVFMTLFNVVAFRITIDSPSDTILPYTVEAAYVPLWGLYATFLAQILSHILSRTLISYHRQSIEAIESKYFVQEHTSETSSEEGEASEARVQPEIKPDTMGKSHMGQTALHRSAFARPHRGENDWLRARRTTNFLVAALVLCSSALLVAGCVLPVYSTRLRGIVSVIQELGRDYVRPREQHNVFTIIYALLVQAKFLGRTKYTLGLVSFATFTVISVVIAPLLLLAALAIRWFYPIPPSLNSRLRAGIEILLSIQCIEVFIVSAIVCALQIDDLSFYLVNDYCSIYDTLFSGLARYGIIDWEDTQCIMMLGYVEYASILLLVSALLIYWLALFVNGADHQKKIEHTIVAQMIPSVCLAEDENRSAATMIEKIHQIPVLFTDRFRCLLQTDVESVATPVFTSSGPTSLPSLDPNA